METLPLISVIIPARNAAATLSQTLDSVSAQTVGDWEVIIVDDGSTDATAAVIESYAARDKRFSALAGRGEGAGSARNLGIAAARGKYLHFLDADDWNDPSFYEKMLSALRALPGAAIAYSACRRVMAGGLLTEPYPIPDLSADAFGAFARGCPIAIHAVLAERALIVRVGAFDTALGNCEDWDLWQRVSRFPVQWVLVDEGLAYYRTAGSSLSNKAEWFLFHSRIIVNRAFYGDERLAGMPDARTSPPDDGLGPIDRACAYNAIWVAGMACGGGNSGKLGEDMLRPWGDAKLEAQWIANVFFEGLIVGTCLVPAQLAERWPEYGPRAIELLHWLGEIWSDPSVARAIQYYLEEMILYADSTNAPRRLGLTQNVRVDITNPPMTVPEPGVDRFHVALTEGQKLLSHISVAVLGTFTRREWLQVSTNFTNVGKIGYRAWRRVGPNADRRLGRRAAALLLRQPGLLRRRSKLRSAWTQLKRSTMDELAAIADPPGTHAARLNEIKAWADEYALAHAAAAPVQPVKPILEQRVDPADLQASFESLFEVEDPWNYGSAYEQEKYERQLAMLPPGKIGRALELACAEGHFTVQLAPLVEHLLATDIASRALSRTQKRCAEFDNIDYQILDYSAGPIPGDMDLILCSETLYYLADESELRKVAQAIAAALRPGGYLITAHAHAVEDDMSRTGFDWGIICGVDVIHRIFSEVPGLVLEHSLDTDLYQIARFRRFDADMKVAAPLIETAPVVEQLERSVARSVIWGGAKALRSQVAHEQRFQVPVLMYHRVSDEGPAALARYRVSREQFKAQIRWLRANGFHGVGAEQILRKIDEKQPFTGRPVMISFDDGFQDFADNAWPILLAHDFTAEVFVVTDRVGKTAIWDAAKAEPGRMMDGATIARLAAEGALFGSHMATHAPLDGLGAEALLKELAGSRAMLAQWLGRPPVSFAAPYWIQDSRLPWAATQCGYRIGFNTGGGAARLDMNRLALPRLEVRGDRPLEAFISQMEATL